eukprot:scaffold249017_cov47-Attheya_sp.AAC.1
MTRRRRRINDGNDAAFPQNPERDRRRITTDKTGRIKDIWLTLLGGTRILLRGIRVGSTEPIIVIPFRCSTPGTPGK